MSEAGQGGYKCLCICCWLRNYCVVDAIIVGGSISVVCAQRVLSIQDNVVIYKDEDPNVCRADALKRCWSPGLEFGGVQVTDGCRDETRLSG